MGEIWKDFCEEMTKEFQKATPHLIPHRLTEFIDLMDDDEDYCGDRILFWEKWLVKTRAPVAMLLVKEYEDVDDYFKRGYNQTARNRLRHARKAGYRCRVMTAEERNDRLDELYEINTSKEIRQGRPMRENYRRYPEKAKEPEFHCKLHFDKLYGCFTKEDKWVGYISGNFCGELAAVAQILGHGDYMKDDFMYLLWYYFIEDIMDNIPNVKYVIYSQWLDGTDGLRYWKRSVGLKPVITSQDRMSYGYWGG
ncbi:MAG: hypothetical protein DRI01_01925 [Chloroflexi bacterium]|nr:MAG: hypothetical protein DRI01_01925 [Chloroflexota bacterium]